MLIPENITIGGGWKSGENWMFCEDADLVSKDTLEECLKEKIYSLNQILDYYHGTYNYSFQITTFNGMVHFLLPSQGAIKTVAEKSLVLNLEPKLNYFLAFLDPRYKYITANPSVIPKHLRKIGPNAGLYIYYLSVSILCIYNMVLINIITFRLSDTNF